MQSKGIFTPEAEEKGKNAFSPEACTFHCFSGWLYPIRWQWIQNITQITGFSSFFLQKPLPVIISFTIIKNISAHFSSPVYYNGLIYGINQNAGARGPFRALDPSNGKIVAEKKSRFGNFIFVGNHLVFISERAELSISSVAITSITTVSETKLKSGIYWTMPVYSSGKLFIRNAPGDLYCINVSYTPN